ncbi:hypothetical protein [Moorena producens]|nr:hypothetical protein [Moorena producens]
MPSIRTVGWSWQEAHTEPVRSVWEYVTVNSINHKPRQEDYSLGARSRLS